MIPPMIPRSQISVDEALVALEWEARAPWHTDDASSRPPEWLLMRILEALGDLRGAIRRETSARAAWAEGYETCLGDFDIAARRGARPPNPYE